MFEAEGVDRKNRIYQIDSSDGYAGVDFNSGSGTLCTVGNGDLTTSGACAPAITLGVSGDAGFTSTGVSALRQMKLLYPTQSSWVWDGGTNTPMVVTMDLDAATAAACAAYKFTQGWALWNGRTWTLQYASNGQCPKLFDGMQAPAPVHLGGGQRDHLRGFRVRVGGARPQLPVAGRQPDGAVHERVGGRRNEARRLHDALAHRQSGRAGDVHEFQRRQQGLLHGHRHPAQPVGIYRDLSLSVSEVWTSNRLNWP